MFSTLIFYEEHGHYFIISFDLLVHPYYTSSLFIPMEVQKTQIKFSNETQIYDEARRQQRRGRHSRKRKQKPSQA